MEFQIIRAAADQVEQAAPLFDRYRQFYGQPSDLARAVQFLRDRITHDESVIFLATAERPLGFVQLYPSFSSVALQRIWMLNDLFVEPEARNLGVGRALLDRAKAWGTQTQAKRIILSTAIDNAAAQALYAKAGYAQDSAFFHYQLEL